MPRSYKQVIVSREEDEYHRTNVVLAGTLGAGTTTAGTALASVIPAAPQSRVFISDIGASCNVPSRLTVKNGTVVIYQQDIPANPNPPFDKTFTTPLKCDQGTTCTAELLGDGRVQINLSGYIRKYDG